ncbi:MAG: serine hydrolase domain-containing protein [Pseudomonadota bacterium]
MKSFRAEKRIPGLAIAVVKSGELAWTTGLGYADSNRTVPITPDTPFWIASVTKTFVGLAYLHLEQQQKVDLDELATKTPGFDGLCRWLASTTILFSKGLDCNAPITIRNILHHQVNEPPGSQFMYNPIMYSRLSRHLEHKFGEGIDAVEGRHNFLGQVIDKEILEPANMHRTMSSMWDRSKIDVYFDLADGFKVDAQGNKTKLRRPDKHIAGGAGVVSTLNDLAKYEIALSQGLIVPEGADDKLFYPATYSSGDISPYGFGWYFQCYRRVKLMWHGGWDPEAGYSALYLRVPEQNVALIALANSENGLWWGNSLTEAQVERSKIAQLFMQTFVSFADKGSADQCALVP